MVNPQLGLSINEYLQTCKPPFRALCVDKPGWFENVYVLPDTAIGEFDEQVVYQGSTINGYEKQGNLSEWQENVAKHCVGNSRLVFSVSVAFASLLLGKLGGESGGFHFQSGSSRGKTTMLKVAKSVCGCSKSLPRWRATANGLEGIAASFNHNLLCLDELSQLAEVDPKIAGESVYMLGNGEGKQRSNRNGGLTVVVN